MVYCISDIHGEYQRYLDMLKLIDFSDADTLYVLGDCIDRHPFGADILLDMMKRRNVVLIQGNHEEMMLATLGSHNVFGAKQLWEQNGGSVTERDILFFKSVEEREAILNYVQNAPDYLDVEVNGRKFYLVHGSAAGTHDDRIWGRPKRNDPSPIPGKTVIVGHTPTVEYYGWDEQPFRIWHGNGIIDIDCGCGNQTPLRRLACICLDNMQEYYV